MRKELEEFKKLEKGWFGFEGSEPFKDSDIMLAHEVSVLIDKLNLEYIIFPNPDNQIVFDFQVDSRVGHKHLTLDVDFNESVFFIHACEFNRNKTLNKTWSKSVNFDNIEEAIKFLQEIIDDL